MQVRQQIVDLLLVEHLAVCRHFVASHPDDVRDPIVIGGHSAHGKVLLLKHVLHAWTLSSAGRIRRMAAVAIIVVDTAPGGLLRVEAQFRVTLAAFDVAGREPHHQRRRNQ